MVEYRKSLLRGAVLVTAGLSLMACQSLRESAGITKQAPDEFAVVSKAPLIIPPDFNLHPPKPGAAPLNQTSPTQSAQAALYGDDPSAIAATMPGNYSQAEKLLLATSGAAAADHGIRRTIASDNANAEDTGDFTDTLLFGGGKTETASPDAPVNADAEKAKIDAAKNGTPPPKSTESATIDKTDNSSNSGSSWWPF